MRMLASIANVVITILMCIIIALAAYDACKADKHHVEWRTPWNSH